MLRENTMFEKTISTALCVSLLAGCGETEEQPDSSQEGAVSEISAPALDAPPPAILAANAFYYYQDLDGAWEFYTRTLGFRTVADYGFAKILQVGPTSFLTLVDEERGMHSSAEPKSVTLAVVTEEVEAWWEYLLELGVEMRSPLGEVDLDRPHNGFVAVDPEGYFLEFERFNPHAENEELIPLLRGAQALYPDGRETAPGVVTTRPRTLGVQATVLWLYYDDLDRIEAFYRDALGVDILVDQGWAKVYPASPTGFLGFVDGARGLHSATREKAVTVSFFTTGLEGWWRRMEGVPDFTFRTEEMTGEGDFVLTFVGYDPDGYFLEWDEFLPVEVNQALLEELGSTG
jgi:catechol 2,3-dioxygenase-like lactoylglutathione lyase family enzyme